MLIEVAVTRLVSQAQQLEGKGEELIVPWTAVCASKQEVAVLMIGALNAERLRKETSYELLVVKTRAA